MRTSLRILAGLTVWGLCACTTETVLVEGSPPASDVLPTGDPAAEEPAPDPSQQGDPTDTDVPSPPLVSGLTISSIAIFQAVKVDVMKDGRALQPSARNAPVVANRPALFRVYVKPAATWQSKSVTAELRLIDGTTRLPILKDTKTIASASTDEDTDSTFNFEVPATSLPPGVTYQVFLTDKAGAVPPGADPARFPTAGGVQDLAIEKSGKLKIVVVPVKYDADSSGRVPDVSAAQLARYQKAFMTLYAASDVEVTARAPFPWSNSISSGGAGFSQILQAITNLRKSDGAAADVYYYGALTPASSFSAYCQGGCVTGLSTVVDNAKNAFQRASVGMGYTGPESVDTALHELGHAHGRNHAPCGGASGVDPDYPYTGAQIGAWGYDIFEKTFVSPTKGRDIMGYCPNDWVSDYTYTALFNRIAAVNGGVSSPATGHTTTSPGSAEAAGTYRMATVDGDGTISWGGDIDLDEAPVGGQTRLATFISAAGQTISQGTARFFPYDHLPGGIMVIPPGPRESSLVSKARTAAPAWKSVRIAGIKTVLVR